MKDTSYFSVRSPTNGPSPRIGGSTELPQQRTKVWLWFTIPLSLIVSAAGYFSFLFLQDPFRKLPELRIDQYFGEFKALQGTHYRLRGRVDASLGWNSDKGRLLAFTVEGTQRRVAALLSPSIGNQDFRKGQSYLLDVTVDTQGILMVNQLKKE